VLVSARIRFRTDAYVRPGCFLHVPKCAGSSVHAALAVAMPDAVVAAKRFDATVFCDFDDFDALVPALRALVAVDDEEIDALAHCDLVSGHFSLPSLRRIAEPSAIATVVREPRSRLLSLYAYGRLADFGMWAPYAAHEHAHRPLEAFLAEPSLAPMIDDQLVRLVLHGDPLLPPQGSSRRRSRSARSRDSTSWRSSASAVHELLRQRTAVTRRVYRALAAWALGGQREARRLASSAFGEQLARFERSFPGTTLAQVRPRRGLGFRSAWTPARRTPS
jgi:hypothetical protein